MNTTLRSKPGAEGVPAKQCLKPIFNTVADKQGICTAPRLQSTKLARVGISLDANHRPLR